MGKLIVSLDFEQGVFGVSDGNGQNRTVRLNHIKKINLPMFDEFVQMVAAAVGASRGLSVKAESLNFSKGIGTAVLK